jgi:hypothetical protein
MDSDQDIHVRHNLLSFLLYGHRPFCIPVLHLRLASRLRVHRNQERRANILKGQFKSVFTKSTSTTLERSTIDRGFNIKTLKIGEQGVFKLPKDINHAPVAYM